MVVRSIRALFDNLFGAGDAALSVPGLDGAFKPNAVIDTGPVRATWPDPDNLVLAGSAVYFSSGGSLLSLSQAGAVALVEDGAPITAMAGAADGSLAIARSGQGVVLRRPSGVATKLGIEAAWGDVTSLAFVGSSLAVTIGAKGALARDWQNDLMRRGQSGSVWLVDGQGKVSKRADNLAYPAGVAADAKGNLLVSVAWDAKVIRLDTTGAAPPVLQNLPGYPSRLISAAKGGYWLAIFAPRNQLVEFVLREKPFRTRMMSEMQSRHWIVPTMHPANGPLDAMQQGTQKVGGAIKPWAPSFSYGLIARLDDDFLPVTSFHSRADGFRHGITSLVEVGDQLLATSRGGNLIVDIATDKVSS